MCVSVRACVCVFCGVCVCVFVVCAGVEGSIDMSFPSAPLSPLSSWTDVISTGRRGCERGFGFNETVNMHYPECMLQKDRLSAQRIVVQQMLQQKKHNNAILNENIR